MIKAPSGQFTSHLVILTNFHFLNLVNQNKLQRLVYSYQLNILKIIMTLHQSVESTQCFEKSSGHLSNQAMYDQQKGRSLLTRKLASLPSKAQRRANTYGSSLCSTRMKLLMTDRYLSQAETPTGPTLLACLQLSLSELKGEMFMFQESISLMILLCLTLNLITTKTLLMRVYDRGASKAKNSNQMLNSRNLQLMT